MSISERKVRKFQKAFGANLKVIREGLDLSQLDLANSCDLEKTTISRIENARTNVTIKTIYRLAQALDIDTKALFEFEIQDKTEKY